MNTETKNFAPSDYRHVNYLWDDEKVKDMSPLKRLVYRSNILGDDLRITNTGGGNTSSKCFEVDPMTGESVEVMWVKGSGGDLRTSKNENFSSLYQDQVLALEKLYREAPDSGVKTEVEDSMVQMYKHCTFNLNPRPSSIDTPLHAYVPFNHVDHMHPNAVIAIAAAENGEALTKQIYGDEVIWTEWQRPGFDLGLIMRDVIAANPQAKGIMMGQHGIINWADDDKECYDLTLTLIEKAARFIEEREAGKTIFGGQKGESLSEEKKREALVEILPWLRGKVSEEMRLIGTVQSGERILEFVNSLDAKRLSDLGTSCPDHFLRTKIKPLYVEWDPDSSGSFADAIEDLKGLLSDGLDRYVADYAAYYERCKRPASPALRQAVPTVVLIPGVGMIAWGKSKSESRVTAEFYNCAIEVMRGAETVDRYRALPEQEAFDIEYWLMEEAKLKRMPPEQALARQVVVVIGAGNGIGKEVCHRICGEGAHIVSVDLKEDAALATAKEITGIVGEGIGISGTGISTCGPAIGLSANITDRASISAMLDEAILAYGGVDSVVVTAGIFVPPSVTGDISDDAFSLTFDINVKGGYLSAKTAFEKIFAKQGLRSNVVITTSANAVVSKKGSIAYDTSKAAANHLVRELAVELSPLTRVNAVAPATVVKGSTMFPRDRVIASLAKYEIEYSDSESDDSLRDKLANFYAQRTLTKSAITPLDQAEAIYLLLTNSLSKTTGHVIPVDGGLHEGFLR
ncbi:MAG: bifunctional rhamnulose-1-phosphate aldolase/short-chain dehydrogenase [Opitutaceae bacterium]|nr:bifunctional rhamnulose-1-phosphate aldolase/short-chain dehydrogenase [Opitutaceae bacterium]